MALVAASPSPKAARLTFFLLGAFVLLTLILHIGYGSTSFVSPLGVLRELVAGPGTGSRENDAVWEIRLSRGIGCVLIGAILGAVGSAFQALFRNPLAEPYIVGVSSGAAVGGVVAFLAGFGSALGGLGQAATGFIFGLGSLGLVFALAGRRGATNVTTLLLAGVVVGAFLSSVLSLALLAGGKDTNILLRWLLGNTYSLEWPQVALLAIALLLGGSILVLQTRALSAFAMGESTARSLGVNTSRLKAVVLITGTGMTAIAVAVSGIIGFLGLVAPHVARSLVGTDWRRSLPASMLTGAALLLAADVLSQRVIPAATGLFGLQPVTDMPVGIVTALIGAPSLLILLRRAN